MRRSPLLYGCTSTCPTLRGERTQALEYTCVAAVAKKDTAWLILALVSRMAEKLEDPLINELLLVGAALGSTETITTEDGR